MPEQLKFIVFRSYIRMLCEHPLVFAKNTGGIIVLVFILIFVSKDKNFSLVLPIFGLFVLGFLTLLITPYISISPKGLFLYRNIPWEHVEKIVFVVDTDTPKLLVTLKSKYIRHMEKRSLRNGIEIKLDYLSQPIETLLAAIENYIPVEHA